MYRAAIRAHAPQPEALLEGLKSLKESLSSFCSTVERPGWLLAGCGDVLIKAVVELRAEGTYRMTSETVLLIVLEGREPVALVEKAKTVVSILTLSGLASVLES